MVVHPDAVMFAHQAGCAAHLQGKFLAFDKMFWEKGFGTYKQTHDKAALGKDAVLKMAAELGLDVKKFESDAEGDTCKQRVQSDMAEMRKFGVNGTPSFFVNGKFTGFSGDGPFKAMIDAELKEVESSGVPADQYYQKVVMEKGEKKFRSKKDAQGG